MKRFGREGDLFKRREELVKPLQDQIFKAIEEIASRGNYAVIFDKAGGANMIYTDVRFDLSDEVLQRMGYRR
jgi:outer membrane protein